MLKLNLCRRCRIPNHRCSSPGRRCLRHLPRLQPNGGHWNLRNPQCDSLVIRICGTGVIHLGCRHVDCRCWVDDLHGIWNRPPAKRRREELSRVCVSQTEILRYGRLYRLRFASWVGRVKFGCLWGVHPECCQC